MGVLRTVTVKSIKGYKAFESLLIRLFPAVVEKLVRDGFGRGDISINGARPWDIRTTQPIKFIRRIASSGSLGLGETYMEGMWECDDIPEMIRRLLAHDVNKIYYNPINQFIMDLELAVFNSQTKSKAWKVGEKHYDLGNDLFKSFLDPSMNYSCGYWRTAENLTQSQCDKMDLIAKKLMLKPGMKVLDIGCGWGSLAKHLATHYGVQVVGITISKEGADHATKVCSDLPVQIELVDYRDIDEKFDRIVSVGMFEHVGHKNYGVFFDTVNRCLKDDGIFLLHTIGVAHHGAMCMEPWFSKYIFPGGQLPYYKHVTDGIEKKFIIEDWQNFGYDYSKTLAAWYENFVGNWPQLREGGNYDEKFFRMWEYYLLQSIGAFRSRRCQLWQLVLSKNGIDGGYHSPR